jgi:hypothetical protein
MKKLIFLVGLVGFAPHGWSAGVSLAADELKASCSDNFIRVTQNSKEIYSLKVYPGSCDRYPVLLNDRFAAAATSGTKIRFSAGGENPLVNFVFDLPA